MALLIKNLKGIFTGEGFVKNDGRKPRLEDAGFLKGPIDLFCEAGKIVEIGKGLSHDAAAELDGSGLVATPGLIDSHTHSLFEGTRAREYFMRWGGQSYIDIAKTGGGIRNTFEEVSNATEHRLEESLFKRLQNLRRLGTTCVEVKSGYAPTAQGELRMLRVLKALAENPRCPIKLRRTFLPLHALPKGANEKKYVDEMISLLPTVAKDGLADHVDAFPEEGFFSLEESLRFSKEAKKLGLRAKVHADELTPVACVENFVPLEAYSVDHLQKISSKGIQALSESSTVATFLPATSFFLALDYAPARKVLDAGAKVSLATDYNPGTAPDMNLLFTARLAASQMKLNAPEIYCGLTYNAASSMGLENSAGTLSPNKEADICLWRFNSSIESEYLEEMIVEAPLPEKTILNGSLPKNV